MSPHGALGDIDAQAGDVGAGIEAAEMELRRELMAGGDTRAIRTFLDAQRRALAELGEARAGLLAQMEEAEAQRIAAAGAALAGEVTGRLRDRLAPLLPPPAPVLPSARA